MHLIGNWLRLQYIVYTSTYSTANERAKRVAEVKSLELLPLHLPSAGLLEKGDRLNWHGGHENTRSLSSNAVGSRLVTKTVRPHSLTHTQPQPILNLSHLSLYLFPKSLIRFLLVFETCHSLAARPNRGCLPLLPILSERGEGSQTWMFSWRNIHLFYLFY